jgi:hypothetical protein
MSETKSFEEENPKEELKRFAKAAALIGIIALALWGLYYLFYYFLAFVGNPLIALFSTITNTLENTIGKVPIVAQFAIIFFMIAGILGFGSLLKKDDARRYRALIIIIWSLAIYVSFAILGAALAGPISSSVAIGLLSILFISPPIVFVIYKGLKSIIDKSNDGSNKNRS